jgi:hypothetical protein
MSTFSGIEIINTVDAIMEEKVERNRALAQTYLALLLLELKKQRSRPLNRRDADAHSKTKTNDLVESLQQAVSKISEPRQKLNEWLKDDDVRSIAYKDYAEQRKKHRHEVELLRSCWGERAALVLSMVPFLIYYQRPNLHVRLLTSILKLDVCGNVGASGPSAKRRRTNSESTHPYDSTSEELDQSDGQEQQSTTILHYDKENEHANSPHHDTQEFASSGRPRRSLDMSDRTATGSTEREATQGQAGSAVDSGDTSKTSETIAHVSQGPCQLCGHQVSSFVPLPNLCSVDGQSFLDTDATKHQDPKTKLHEAVIAPVWTEMSPLIPYSHTEIEGTSDVFLTYKWNTWTALSCHNEIIAVFEDYNVLSVRTDDFPFQPLMDIIRQSDHWKKPPSIHGDGPSLRMDIKKDTRDLDCYFHCYIPNTYFPPTWPSVIAHI